jgi:hypothetical protein
VGEKTSEVPRASSRQGRYHLFGERKRTFSPENGLRTTYNVDASVARQ